MSTNSIVAGVNFWGSMQVAQPLQPRIRHGHDADIRIDGAEGVIIGWERPHL